MASMRAVRLHDVRDVRLDRADKREVRAGDRPQIDGRAAASAQRAGATVAQRHNRDLVAWLRARHTGANGQNAGALGYTRTVWDRTLELIRARRLPVERAVTARIASDEVVEQGFAAQAAPSNAELKVLVALADQ